jgi:Uma2 family endonuclease
MSTAAASRITRPALKGVEVPLLVNGDRMKQPEFHRRYEDYPDKKARFELVGGTVYMASPLRWPHGTYDRILGMVFSLYAAGTRGVQVGGNATVILGEESEPQPDLAVRILPEYGGGSRLNAEEYVEGPPELLAEIAYSSRAIDMNQKRDDYERAGVREYVVLCVEEQELHWFDFAARKTIRPRRDGACRSRVFPGLWVHVAALLEQDAARLVEVVQQGLAGRQHAAFVKRLAAARRRRP